ncbi:MAG: hypothetical protein WC716_05555 [Chitinophagaceae bacterium]|jgi:hypothetical protein
MVKELWDSFKDNLKERATNPFLGTFAVVWIIRNHRVCFALFNFDKGYTLETKLDFIANHYPHCDFFYNLVSTVGVTLLVLIGTYLLLFVSRMLTDYYQNNVIPWGAGLIKESSVILRADWDTANEKIEQLKELVKEERKKRFLAEEERDSADKLVLAAKESIEAGKKLDDVFKSNTIKEKPKQEETNIQRTISNEKVERVDPQRVLSQMEKDNAPIVRTFSTFSSALSTATIEDDISTFYLKNKLTYNNMSAEELINNDKLLNDFVVRFRSQNAFRPLHLNDKELKFIIKKELNKFVN